MEYPTIKGIAVSLSEIELPETRLNPNRLRNFNVHHHEWTKRQMGRFLITQTLRDLERHQTLLPLDVHNSIHDRYNPPRFPTLEQAIEAVDDAYQLGESLHIYRGSQKGYVLEPITADRMRQIGIEYSTLRG